MPPHGGHGGGGHHGGGGRHWGGSSGALGFPWGWYNVPWGYTEPEVIERCPSVWAPVLDSRGRTWANACVAQMNGAKIVKSLPREAFGDVTLPVVGTVSTPVAVGLGIGAYLVFKKLMKKRRG